MPCDIDAACPATMSDERPGMEGASEPLPRIYRHGAPPAGWLFPLSLAIGIGHRQRPRRCRSVEFHTPLATAASSLHCRVGFPEMPQRTARPWCAKFYRVFVAAKAQWSPTPKQVLPALWCNDVKRASVSPVILELRCIVQYSNSNTV